MEREGYSEDADELLAPLGSADVRRDYESASIDCIRLAHSLREREQDMRERDGEVERLRGLVEAMQEQHHARISDHLSEKSKLATRLRQAEDTASLAEKSLHQANEDLERSLADREELSTLINNLMRDKETRMFQVHQAQDESDEWQAKFDRLETEREHDNEELQALRSSSDFNEQYVKTLKQSYERVQEHARKVQSELQTVLARGDAAPYTSRADDYLPPPPPPPALPHHSYSEPYDPHEDDSYAGEHYLADPMSPVRERHIHHHYASSPHYEEEEEEYLEASPRTANREYEEEMQRMGAKLAKLSADLHSNRVEEAYVQKEYMVEAGTRLNGAVAALETLCAVIADWKASISCGREPWGKLASKEDELRLRRLRDIEKRATMKKEVSRTLELTGMAEEAVAVLEVYFASNRVRDAVTYVVEAFQTSKDAADTCMGHAKRTIEESVASAKAQSDTLSAQRGDAGQLDAELRNLTQAKFEAENTIEKLKHQVEERDAYRQEVERLSKLMKDEAQDERKKMSEIALTMTEKQQEEISRLGTQQREDLDAIAARHMAQLREMRDTHTGETARAAAEIQQLTDKVAEMQRSLEEKDRQLEAEVAKKRSAKNAKEQAAGELNGMKQAMSSIGKENRELRGMLKMVEKENMVLKELSSKLESDVRRGRIMVEGETTRTSFEAWQSKRVANPMSESAHSRSPSQSAERSHTASLDRRARSRDVFFAGNSHPQMNLRPTSLRPYP